jgi:DNA-binding XRE family transcriptional regulator
MPRRPRTHATPRRMPRQTAPPENLEARLLARILARCERLEAHLADDAPDRPAVMFSADGIRQGLNFKGPHKGLDTLRGGVIAPSLWDTTTAAACRTLAPALAARQARDLCAVAEELIADRTLRAAALHRQRLIDRWPMPPYRAADPALPDWQRLGARFEHARLVPGAVSEDDLGPFGFPLDVAIEPATEAAIARLEADDPRAIWMRAGLEALREGTLSRQTGEGYLQADTINEADAESLWHFWTGALLVAGALAEVDADRRRRYVAIDTGAPHTQLLDGLTQTVSRDGRGHVAALATGSLAAQAMFRDGIGRLELLAPGHAVQLSLALGDGSTNIPEATIQLIEQVHRIRTVRHYAAVLESLTVSGRTGRFVWSVDRHLERMGIHSNDWNQRTEAIAAVKNLSLLEIAIYDQNNKLRVRSPLLRQISSIDRNVAPQGEPATWELGGFELEIARPLYEGIRGDDGTLGTNWYPQSPLARYVDERHDAGALRLGLTLGFQFRRAWADGKPIVTLKGQTALTKAGIALSARRPGEAWAALERALNTLRDLPEPAIGGWRWRDTARQAEALLEIWPADWQRDRTLLGITPLEPRSAEALLTGADLRAYRVRHGLTQDALATRLSVTARTLREAERHPERPLSTRLRRKLAADQEHAAE